MNSSASRPPIWPPLIPESFNLASIYNTVRSQPTAMRPPCLRHSQSTAKKLETVSTHCQTDLEVPVQVSYLADIDGRMELLRNHVDERFGKLEGIVQEILKGQRKMLEDMKSTTTIQQTSVFNWTDRARSELCKQVSGCEQDLSTQIARVQQDLIERVNSLENSFSSRFKRLDEKQSARDEQQQKLIQGVNNSLVTTVKDAVSNLSKTLQEYHKESTDLDLGTEAHRGSGQECATEKKHNYSFTRLFSSVTRHSDDQSEALDKLMKDKSRLHHKVQEVTAQYKELYQRYGTVQSQCDGMHKEVDRLRSMLMVYKRQTEGEWKHDSETPSYIAKEFEKLFGITRRNSDDKSLKSPEGRALANDIFKAAYEECHTMVLKELFKELFTHHEHGANTTTADDQKRIYGKLLGLKGKKLQETTEKHPLVIQVMERAGINCESMISDSAAMAHHPMYCFVQRAVEIALAMIAMQPPMVIDYPTMFKSDDVQEKQCGFWDDAIEDDKSDLHYFRPVLYTNYCEPVCKSAQVGNTNTISYY